MKCTKTIFNDPDNIFVKKCHFVKKMTCHFKGSFGGLELSITSATCSVVHLGAIIGSILNVLYGGEHGRAR